MKERHDPTAYAVITGIYVLAASVSFSVFRLVGDGLFVPLLTADVTATVVVFLFSALFRNASVYDPYWSLQPIVICAALIVSCGCSGAGYVIFAVILVWGLRLTANWGYTFASFSYEDWRYRMLRAKTGAFYPVVNFFGIHLFPTLIVFGCVYPAALVITKHAALNVPCVIFAAISLAAAIIQGTADLQMHAFRKNRSGGFMRKGLWKYTRHPNYLCEIVMWWGIALASVSVLGFRWYLIVGAAANTLMFLVISIPMADKRYSVRPGWVEYKNSTRALLPIPRHSAK